ncbi:MAG TPA: sigma-70 family RNA polymerase sigma factor [Candidatus Tectomicrobia bacterium]|nr:sigma-70 family RNA polymerase sigma factor [Candidatus Tectomicrobia bacterium]
MTAVTPLPATLAGPACRMALEARVETCEAAAADDLASGDLTDEALCRRIARRDEAAFDLLVGRWQARAYRLAWSILRDAEDARDVSQEAFVRLFQRAGSFRGDARFSTWFYRLLVNLCLDHRRRRRWWLPLPDLLTRRRGDASETPEVEPSWVAADPLEALQDVERSRRLWAAVERLPARQRAAVVLQAQEGLSTSEIAAVLQCAEATVRVHLHRAITALRRTLGPSGTPSKE